MRGNHEVEHGEDRDFEGAFCQGLSSTFPNVEEHRALFGFMSLEDQGFAFRAFDVETPRFDVKHALERVSSDGEIAVLRHALELMAVWAETTKTLLDAARERDDVVELYFRQDGGTPGASVLLSLE